MLDKELAHYTPPPDSITIMQLAKLHSLTYSAADCLIHRLVREGKLRMIGKFVVNGRPTNHYELIK